MLTNAHNWQFVKLSEINELAAKRLSRATKSGPWPVLVSEC